MAQNKRKKSRVAKCATPFLMQIPEKIGNERSCAFFQGLQYFLNYKIVVENSLHFWYTKIKECWMKNCSCNGSSFRKLISIYVGLSPVYSIFFDMVHHYFACLFMFFTICQSVDVFFFGHWNLIPLGHENLSGIDRLSRVALRVTCGFPQLLT